MDNALARSAAKTHDEAAKLDWRKKISNHVAWGLLTYTGLQIFITMTVLKSHGASILPYFALVVLVGAIIPGCRLFETRWSDMSDAEAADPSYAGAFRRDIAMIWAFALGLPFAITGLFKLAGSLLS